MRPEYSEQDTERARQAEHSSAGLSTQSPGLPSEVEATPSRFPPVAGRNNALALALIAIGVLMFIGRVMPDTGDFMGGMVLLIIASCFLFFAFWKRNYGLMIPGAILSGLSLGVTFASVTAGVSVLWGLALGFLGILFLGRLMFGVNNQWPVYPAVPLFAVGVIVALSNLPVWMVGSLIWLPLLLIGAGIYLGWARR